MAVPRESVATTTNTLKESERESTIKVLESENSCQRWWKRYVQV
jgi:hypothetical protein